MGQPGGVGSKAVTRAHHIGNLIFPCGIGLKILGGFTGPLAFMNFDTAAVADGDGFLQVANGLVVEQYHGYPQYFGKVEGANGLSVNLGH